MKLMDIVLLFRTVCSYPRITQTEFDEFDGIIRKYTQRVKKERTKVNRQFML